MPLSNYTELQASIADWMDREDLVARIPDFIQLGQAKLRRVLRVREMEISTTLTPINGVCFLPTNYEEFRAVYASTGTGKPLELITPDFAIQKYGWSASAGCPQYFTLIGNELRPYPSTTGDVGLIYYQSIPDIAAASTNWLLTKDPRTYLFASLLQAEAFMMGDDRIQVWSAGLEQALSELGVADARSRWARASARVSGPTP